MVHSFTLAPSNLNVATPLATSRKPATWAVIQAKGLSGAADVRVVAKQADGTFPTTGGVVLQPNSTSGEPGANLGLPFMGAPHPYDFSTIAIIITHTGDGVDVFYGS